MATKAKVTNKKTKPAEIQPAVVSRKTRLVGKVVSDKMTSTVVVLVSRKIQHPLYKKTILHTKKYKAHNTIDAKTGDTVQIEETRPMSKSKRFLVTQIVNKVVEITPELNEEKSDLDLLIGIEAKPEEVKTEKADVIEELKEEIA